MKLKLIRIHILCKLLKIFMLTLKYKTHLTKKNAYVDESYFYHAFFRQDNDSNCDCVSIKEPSIE